jgi:hypothetical protein
MHRESGLAHRHYVLKAWQVRALRALTSRPMLLVYVVAIVTWGWTTSQALRVPMLQRRIGVLTRDADRLDTLTSRLTELQARYDQVQRMLGPAKAATVTSAATTAAATAATAAAASRTATRDTSRDTTRTPARDTLTDSARRASVVRPPR